MTNLSTKYSHSIIREFLEYQFDNSNISDLTNKIDDLLKDYEVEITSVNKTEVSATKLKRLTNFRYDE